MFNWRYKKINRTLLFIFLTLFMPNLKSQFFPRVIFSLDELDSLYRTAFSFLFICFANCFIYAMTDDLDYTNTREIFFDVNRHGLSFFDIINYLTTISNYENCLL